MLKIERRNEILGKLEKFHSMSIHHLASELNVSEATVRRDLNSLEHSGLVKRVFGGVTLTKYMNNDLPLWAREQENRNEKAQIAHAASKFITDGDIIILDASSSAQLIVPYLSVFKNLTVITNCIKILEQLAELGIKTYCTGGALIGNSLAFSGWYAERMIKDIKADLLFFSCQGLSMDGRLSDSSNDETRLRQTMLEAAKKKIFLCDSSKIGKNFMFKVCDISDIDEVISNIILPAEIRNRLSPDKV